MNSNKLNSPNENLEETVKILRAIKEDQQHIIEEQKELIILYKMYIDSLKRPIDHINYN